MSEPMNDDFDDEAITRGIDSLRSIRARSSASSARTSQRCDQFSGEIVLPRVTRSHTVSTSHQYRRFRHEHEEADETPRRARRTLHDSSPRAAAAATAKAQVRGFGREETRPEFSLFTEAQFLCFESLLSLRLGEEGEKAVFVHENELFCGVAPAAAVRLVYSRSDSKTCVPGAEISLCFGRLWLAEAPRNPPYLLEQSPGTRAVTLSARREHALRLILRVPQQDALSGFSGMTDDQSEVPPIKYDSSVRLEVATTATMTTPLWLVATAAGRVLLMPAVTDLVDGLVTMGKDKVYSEWSFRPLTHGRVCESRLLRRDEQLLRQCDDDATDVAALAGGTVTGESEIVDYLLYTLMGHGVSLTQSDTVRGTVERWLSLNRADAGARSHLRQHLVPLVEAVTRVRRFVFVEARVTQFRGQQGQVLQAFCGALERQLRRVDTLAVQLETQHRCAQRPLSLQAMHYFASDTGALMRVLVSLIDDCCYDRDNNDVDDDGDSDSGGDLATGGRLLSQVHAFINTTVAGADGEIQRALQEVLRDTARPFAWRLARWLHHGALSEHDVAGDFCVWPVPPQEADGIVRDVSLRQTALPHFLRPHAVKVLRTGALWRLTRKGGARSDTRDKTDALTSLLNTRLLREWVSQQHALASQALLSHLVRGDTQVHTLVAQLRGLMCLGSSDLFDELFDLGERELRRPSRDLRPVRIQGIFESALRASSACRRWSADALLRRFRPVLTERRLDELHRDVVSREVGTCLSGWDALSLHAHVAFPLELLLPVAVRATYETVFRTLLRMRLCQRRLCEAWRQLVSLPRQCGASAPTSALMLRSEMHSTVTALLRYASVDTVQMHFAQLYQCLLCVRVLGIYTYTRVGTERKACPSPTRPRRCCTRTRRRCALWRPTCVLPSRHFWRRCASCWRLH
ncbi:MAG: hypothetical protein MHM6MM_000541 [Cercozoa sp. M6MM]